MNLAQMTTWDSAYLTKNHALEAFRFSISTIERRNAGMNLKELSTLRGNRPIWIIKNNLENSGSKDTLLAFPVFESRLHSIVFCRHSIFLRLRN